MTRYSPPNFAAAAFYAGFWFVLQAPDADGSKIELDQSEPAMRDSARSADAHRIVPVG
jgi:hypothetical protein